VSGSTSTYTETMRLAIALVLLTPTLLAAQDLECALCATDDALLHDGLATDEPDTDDPLEALPEADDPEADDPEHDDPEADDPEADDPEHLDADGLQLPDDPETRREVLIGEREAYRRERAVLAAKRPTLRVVGGYSFGLLSLVGVAITFVAVTQDAPFIQDGFEPAALSLAGLGLLALAGLVLVIRGTQMRDELATLDRRIGALDDALASEGGVPAR